MADSDPETNGQNRVGHDRRRLHQAAVSATRVLKIPKLVVVGRLRKDAALRDLPVKLKRGQRRGRGRPRKYGPHKLSLAKRAGQQQVRNIWTNLTVYNMNLWMHTLVELWAWQRPGEQLCNRSDSPWDDASRRPSHANRR